jgi:ipoprotein LpqH
VATATNARRGRPAQVAVDGRPLNVLGPVECSTTNGEFSIAIGEAITGVIVGLEPDASAVHNAGFVTVDAACP